MPALGRFAATAIQLALVLLVVRVYAIEAAFGLVAITPVVFLGFLVHAWLPAAWKLPAFLVLSLAAFGLVLGPVHGALAVGLAAILFGLCHAPGPTKLRVALLLLAGAGLAALRSGSIETSWAGSVVPVVAAMFMFRSILYLYDQRTEQRTGEPPASWWLRLSYFFLLPNVCFLLFPVVDYKTFRRTYRERPDHEIHQRGVEWMLRGVVHLLLYRVVYFYMTPSFEEVRDLWGVVLFAVSSFLLYLRISGQFHLIVGMLHLFGFHLPPTHNLYLLASSFSDCWRRINVYWTEFMKKVVYYPAFVRLRRRGMLFALVASTGLTFLATWLLHAYQWFWLHGDLPLTRDGMFWGFAGLLALVSMLSETRAAAANRPGARRLGNVRPSWRQAARRSAATLAVFMLICAIWSLWATPSPERWLALVERAGRGPRAQGFALLAILASVFVIGTELQRLPPLPGLRRGAVRGPRSEGRPVATAFGALALVLLGLRPVQEAFGPTVAGALLPITADFLNRSDRERLTDTYYDRLIDRGPDWGGRLREQARLDGDDPENFVNSPLAALTGAPLEFEIQPMQRDVFLGALFESNRWGMRDKHYELEKPAGTVRVAVLGACSEVGTGVTNPQVWEALTELRLNQSLSPQTGHAYEILNFSVPGYTLLHHVTVLREKVLRFQPDFVLVSDHIRESLELLVTIATGEDPWPAGLAEVLAEAGVTPGMEAGAVHDLLLPGQERIEAWALGALAAETVAAGARPVYLLGPFLEPLRGLEDPVGEARLARLLEVARERKYELLDISDAFAGETYESAAIVRLQNCPSVRGHQLMAARFYEALVPLFESDDSSGADR